MSDTAPITELSRQQRRVLGVLVEKGLTTPEYYPLTLKALTAGCNQKSNRSPVVNYSEDEVVDVIEELNALELVAVVYPESGRTERYRHFMRKRFDLTEPQLAILIELMLRGRQQLGELRSRASRMVAIDTLEKLREELGGLARQKLIQANGPLERRGIEVDHLLYRPNEAARTMPAAAELAAEEGSTRPANERAGRYKHHDAREAGGIVETTVTELREQIREMRNELSAVQDQLATLSNRVEDLYRELGG